MRLFGQGDAAIAAMLGQMLRTPAATASPLAQLRSNALTCLARTPGIARETQLKINEKTRRALAMSQVKEKLAALGLDPDPGTPEALSLLIAAEIKKWAAVVRQSGAKIN